MPDNEYKKYIGFKSLFYFCSLPIRLDSYRGCFHGCLYCFSQSLNNRKEGFFNRVVPANPTRFSNLMESALIKKKSKGLIKSCLVRKVPIHFGCVSDPLQKDELKYKVTYEILKTFNNYNYPFVLSTKSDLVVNDKYLDLLSHTPSSIQISFSTFDDNLAKNLEPNVPSPSERLRVLKTLSDKNIYTVARLQPFLYGVDKISNQLIRKIAETGAKHIILEHLRIPTNSKLGMRNKLWNTLGINLLDRYKKDGIKTSRVNFELKSNVKLRNILKAKEIANTYGMTFGAGDNDFHHFSDNLCCCGIPDNEDFKNIYMGHLGYGIFKGMKSGNLSFSYIYDAWHPSGSIKEYVNSDCRLKGDNDVISLLTNKIENPKSSNSPETFYGVNFSNNSHYTIDKEVAANIVSHREHNDIFQKN